MTFSNIQILRDDSDSKQSLKLSKRSSEFKGSIDILVKDSILIQGLHNLKYLNLYDNHLRSLNGIGVLANIDIEEISLGCNELTDLPLEV